MLMCGQEFSAEILERIMGRVREVPDVSRRALSREVCEWLDWRAANGQWQEMQCRVALGKLEAHGELELPPAQRWSGTRSDTKRWAQEFDPMAPFTGELGALGAIELVRVEARDGEAHRGWRSLLQREHYLGAPKLCGRQLRYLVMSARHGVVGAMAFSSAAWRVGAREEFIGWSEDERRANLGAVICNSRFLIAQDKAPEQARRHLRDEARLRGLPEPDWAQEEFGRARLGDARLEARLEELARDFYARPCAQIPQACGTRAKTKAAYRFFEHEQTSMKAILAPHYEATAERVTAHAVVLAAQDTTSLNYDAQPAMANLGPIGSEVDRYYGLLVHDTMAFTPEGLALGLIDVQSWARDASAFGKKHDRKSVPIEAKESNKWLKSVRAAARVQAQCPDTQVVSVGDREADVYELFDLVRTLPNAPQLLIRAEQDRRIEGTQERLWAHIQAQPISGLPGLVGAAHAQAGGARGAAGH